MALDVYYYYVNSTMQKQQDTLHDAKWKLLRSSSTSSEPVLVMFWLTTLLLSTRCCSFFLAFFFSLTSSHFIVLFSLLLLIGMFSLAMPVFCQELLPTEILPLYFVPFVYTFVMWKHSTDKSTDLSVWNSPYPVFWVHLFFCSFLKRYS